MKNKILYLSIILIVLLIGIILIKILIVNEDTSIVQNNRTSNTSVNSTNSMEHTLIDMNNTENAKISPNRKENISKKLADKKSFKGMSIENIKLVAENGKSNLTATIENNSGVDYEGGPITIIFMNSDGSEYGRLESVLPNIKNNTSNQLNASTTNDLINAFDFTIE